MILMDHVRLEYIKYECREENHHKWSGSQDFLHNDSDECQMRSFHYELLQFDQPIDFKLCCHDLNELKVERPTINKKISCIPSWQPKNFHLIDDPTETERALIVWTFDHQFGGIERIHYDWFSSLLQRINEIKSTELIKRESIFSTGNTWQHIAVMTCGEFSEFAVEVFIYPPYIPYIEPFSRINAN